MKTIIGTGTGVFDLRVLERNRYALGKALRRPANCEVFTAILGEGFASGSTEWRVVVTSPSTAQRIQDVLWQEGMAWVNVRELTPDEAEAM